MAGAGVGLLAAAGIGRLGDKGIGLTPSLIELFDRWLAPLGLELASPRDPDVRGAHVCLRHPSARQLCQALIEDQVLPDYREPDLVRFAVSALTTSFADVHEAMRRLRALVMAGTYLDVEIPTSRVT